MTSACTETVNGTPQEESVMEELEAAVAVIKTSTSTATEDTTPPTTPTTTPSSSTIEDTEERDVTVVESVPIPTVDEDNHSTTSSSSDDDFGFGMVMGMGGSLPREEEEETSMSFMAVPTLPAQPTTPPPPVPTEQVEEEDEFGFGFVMGASASLPSAEKEEDVPVAFSPYGVSSSVGEEGEEVVQPQPQAQEPTTVAPRKTLDKAPSTEEDENSVVEEEEAETTDALTPPVQKKKSERLTMADTVRKGAVAVAGGTLTAVGLVMIPLPTPMGCVVAGSGMALLGTEFEAANRVMENMKTTAEDVRDQLIEHCETAIEDEGYMAEVKEENCIEITMKKKTEGGEQQSQNASTDNNETTTNAQQTTTTTSTDESHEFVIAVNADPYFDQEEEELIRQRNEGGFVNNYIYNPLQSARQRLGVEKKGFLATSVLPLLQKTKQFSSNGAGSTTAKTKGSSTKR